ncbi:right-handed parallel beta-helix repeat-containing protein [Roseimaritima ulvae]|uniref:Right handed beta helix domain-containing protein n=1 Tax=Roseimaritima ulvae TaxID=980254 RepID=A0A5B9QN65_9BACT|nr:right-handed parallel beta-helix repeat-containing protein [Roseimaritima ulvae]QEG40537.1 hypothetical protein UC8_25520 [Roseimaritima ulvae]
MREVNVLIGSLRIGLLVVVVAAALGPALAAAQGMTSDHVPTTRSGSVEHGDTFRAYTSLAGQLGDPNRVHANLFVPLLADRDSLLFADVRGQYMAGGGGEGNWGLAYREMFDDRFILGVYGFYDLKQSAHENTFHQGTLGAEMLSDRWDVRGNLYLPEGGSAQAVAATAVVSDGNLVVQNNIERAYHGIDAEVGALLCRLPQCGDSELRCFAGGYHFDTHSAAARSISGPRLRAEWRSFDLPMLALDSRLTIGIQYQYDSVRDSQTSATFAIRMPFGFDRQRHRRMTRMQRRMTDVIVRDADVVTHVTPRPGGQETALHAVYDFEIGSVTVLDADTSDLPGAVAAATTTSVIVDGGRGQISLSDPIEVQDGQQLLGGGLQVKGADTGVLATFGTPVTLRGTDPTQSVILTADNSVISGFNIYGGLHGISSELPGGLDNLNDVLIIGNNVTGAEESGFRFGELDGDSVIAHNRATDNGGHGFDIEKNEGVFVQNNALGNAENGFDLFDNDGDVSLNRSLRNGGFGFFADDNSGAIEENESYENEMSGFDFLNNTGSIAHNLSADNGGQGYTFASNFGVVESNAAFDNGSFGFDFDANDGVVKHNLAFDNGGVGFDFTDNLGDFHGNIATGNADTGFDFIANTGRFFDNEAVDNGDVGFDFTENLGLFQANIANNNAAEGFDFTDNWDRFLANQAIENGSDGFWFDENLLGGTFADNVANDNDGAGYDGVNSGTAVNNTGSNNQGGGNTFP